MEFGFFFREQSFLADFGPVGTRMESWGVSGLMYLVYLKRFERVWVRLLKRRV